MKIKKTKISDCYEIFVSKQSDERGWFFKSYNREIYDEYNLNINFAEMYTTFSVYGSLRGLHFQTPPFEHDKLVCCVIGRVFDVVLDLREYSPTYKKYQSFELSNVTGNALLIPAGTAHGFTPLSRRGAIINYVVSSVYSPDNDKGILWNSAGIDWPIDNPILSKRDKSFPPLSDFDTPFLDVHA